MTLAPNLRERMGVTEEHAFPFFTSLGSYPCIYLTRQSNVVCANCANTPVDEGDAVIDTDIYWEGPPIECDDCGRMIESAYGEPD